MTENCKINVYGDKVLFSLKGKNPSDFENGLGKAFDYISQLNRTNPDAFLQTFVDTAHREELDFFLRQGFFISNTMLFMELDLNRFATGATEADKKNPGEKLLTGSDISGEITLEEYDLAKGLDEYLKANGEGFGEQDPAEMIEEELNNPGAKIYVVRLPGSKPGSSGKIVSSVTVWEIAPGVYATENIFTVPKYREKHLASAMLKRVLFTLAANGNKKARLSVYGDDLEALGLYYGLGFELTGEKYELRY